MNKKKWLSMFLACCMVVGMIPAALASEGEPMVGDGEPTVTQNAPAEAGEPTALNAGNVANVAKVDNTEYATLQEAINKADGKQITLLSDVDLTEDATWENVKINCATFRIQVEAGATLTINGSGTEFTNAQSSTASLLRAVGTLNINGGTYTSNYIEPIVIWGTANITDGTFKSTVTTTANNGFDGQGVIVVNGRDGKEKCPGTLNMTGGTIIVDDKGTAAGYAMHGLTVFNDGVITLGKEGDNGPTIKGEYCAIGMNNKYGPITLTINSGTYSCKDATGSEKFNANIYMSAASNITIKGGKFTAADGNAYVFSVPYTDVDVTLNIEGGTFEAPGSQTVFRPKEKQETAGGENKGAPSVTVTGGTFSSDPSQYVPKTHHVTEDSSKFTVEEGALVFGAALDTRGNSSISATPFTVSKDDPTVFEATVSGTVDMRTYLVTDTVLQKDFSTLLTNKREVTPINLLADPIPNKYVLFPLNLVFADMDFLTYDGKELGKTQNDYYYIQQTNSGMGYAYTTANVDGPKSGVKEGRYQGTRQAFTDGLTFLIYDKTQDGVTGDITFKIAPCDSDTDALPDKNVTTFIIHNEISFTETDAPAAEDPVVEVETKTQADGSVTAEVKNTDVTTDKINAAAGAESPEDKVLVIDASGVSGAGITKTEITLTKDVVGSLAGDAAKDITTEIKTPVGTVTLPAEAAKQISDGAGNGDVKLVVEKVDSVSVPTGAEAAYTVEVQKATGDKVEIEDLNQFITFSFYIGRNRASENPTLYYVKEDENGNKTFEAIESSYDNSTGYITGKTSHLSTFALISLPAIDGGLGKEITVTATDGNYVTVQVSSGTANAIYTVEVPRAGDSTGEVVISAPNGSTVTVWETTAKPTFDPGTGAITSEVVKTQTVTLN